MRAGGMLSGWDGWQQRLAANDWLDAQLLGTIRGGRRGAAPHPTSVASCKGCVYGIAHPQPALQHRCRRQARRGSGGGRAESPWIHPLQPAALTIEAGGQAWDRRLRRGASRKREGEDNGVPHGWLVCSASVGQEVRGGENCAVEVAAQSESISVGGLPTPAWRHAGGRVCQHVGSQPAAPTCQLEDSRCPYSRMEATQELNTATAVSRPPPRPLLRHEARPPPCWQ